MSLHGQATSYLKELRVPNDWKRFLHWQHAGLLMIPGISKSRMGARAFSYQTPLLWNHLRVTVDLNPFGCSASRATLGASTTISLGSDGTATVFHCNLHFPLSEVHTRHILCHDDQRTLTSVQWNLISVFLLAWCQCVRITCFVHVQSYRDQLGSVESWKHVSPSFIHCYHHPIPELLFIVTPAYIYPVAGNIWACEQLQYKCTRFRTCKLSFPPLLFTTPPRPS